MSVKNWTGAGLCALLFAASFLVADGALHFLNGVGLLIVLSGTLGATLLSYPWGSFKSAARVGWNSYVVSPPTSEQIIRNLIEISVHSRFEGIVSLEKFEKQTTVGFLRNALEMMVDGYPAREIRQNLETERAYFHRRREQHERVFRHMARLAPAFGVAGSVIGLMGMLFGVGDTGVILRTIPLALTSTLYGILISNFFLTPIAESIHFKTTRELLINKLIIDGVTAILEEQNPHKLERRLESFLTPAARGKRRPIEEIRERYRDFRSEREAAAAR